MFVKGVAFVYMYVCMYYFTIGDDLWLVSLNKC